MPEWKGAEKAPATITERNQNNAQHSTGPQTDAGKERSSQNARKHGLSCRELVIWQEEREEWQQFEAAWLADLQPAGMLEITLAGEIIASSWNLRRVRLLEAGVCDGGLDPLADPESDKKLDRLARYTQRFERTFHRAIKELRTVQTIRSQRASVLPVVRDTIPPRADTAKAVLAKRTHPALSHEEDLKILLASVERESDILMASCSPPQP